LKFFYKNFQAISLESKKSFLYFLFLLLLRVYLVFISRERRKNFASNFSVALSSQKKATHKNEQDAEALDGHAPIVFFSKNCSIL
jgi:hypothetical protein